MLVHASHSDVGRRVDLEGLRQPVCWVAIERKHKPAALRGLFSHLLKAGASYLCIHAPNATALHAEADHLIVAEGEARLGTIMTVGEDDDILAEAVFFFLVCAQPPRGGPFDRLVVVWGSEAYERRMRLMIQRVARREELPLPAPLPERRAAFEALGRAARRVACPCCGYPTLERRGDFEICELCWWEDDGQDDPRADDVRGGPNERYSLTQARRNFGDHLTMYDRGKDTRVSEEDGPALVRGKRALIDAFEALRGHPEGHRAMWRVVKDVERNVSRLLNRQLRTAERRRRR